MDTDTLYGGLRWSIIERIARTAKSPLELAKDLATSIANISMHLRVLEAAGVVTKQRISNSKAGEPRILYEIAKEIFLVSYASSELQLKQQIDITPEKKVLMQLWQLPSEIHGPLATFYFTHQEYFGSGYNLYYASHSSEGITLIASNDQPSKPAQQLSVVFAGVTHTITLKFISLFELTTPSYKLIHRGLTFGEKP